MIRYLLFLVSGFVIADCMQYYFVDKIERILQKHPEMNRVFLTFCFILLAVFVYLCFVMTLIEAAQSYA